MKSIIIFIFLFFSLTVSAGAFSDIAENSHYSLPLSFLNENFGIQGFDDGTFRPEEIATRGEALAIIQKTMAAAKEKNLVKGAKKTLEFNRLDESVNLAEALRIMFSAAGIKTKLSKKNLPDGIPEDAWYAKDISYAVSKTILTQQQNGNIFPPERPLKRGELALLLYRFLQSRRNISFGYGSWYGDGLAKTGIPKGHGYVENFLTAANKELPFGTIVRVTNMENGKTVEVVINDSGPYVTGRIIDLSKTAFSKLASPGAGIISIQMEPLE